MNRQELTQIAIRHWREFRPEATADLDATEMLQTTASRAAQNAIELTQRLKRSGYPEHEAEAMAMQEFIYLAPEIQPSPEDEEEEREAQQHWLETKVAAREVLDLVRSGE